MARINPRLAREARPLLQAFLGPLLRTGDGFGGLGRIQAKMDRLEWPAHRQYAERYARMLRPDGPFPEASTLWRLGAALKRRHAWCAQPLLLLGSGHLGAFIDVFADAVPRLGTAQALALLDAAPRAIRYDADAQNLWDLSDDEARNFRDPQECATIATVDSYDVRVARQVAVMFDVPLARRQEIAFDHLRRWLLDFAERA